MASIVSTGVGSGLDIAGIVQKLVEAEGQPKALRLDREEAKAQSRLSALGSLRSALAGFRDALAVLQDVDKFQGRKVTLSQSDFVSATAASSAAPGTYSLEVEALARAHKLQSGAYEASTGVGTGTLTLEIAGETFDVVVDGTDNTVSDLAAAINASAAGDKVQATVISGAAGAVLSMAARDSGADSTIVLSAAGDAELTAFAAGFTTIEAASDARARIDGVEVTSATNTLSGAIAGIDITLLAENEDGETTSLTVAFDRNVARKSIDDFVKAYNGVVDTVAALASYNAETRTGGPLFGDAGVRNIVYQLRRELSAATAGVDAAVDTLNEIGVTAELDGKLSVDAEKLDAAFDAGFDGIGALFSSDGEGLAVRLDALLDPYLDSGGVFDSRTSSLKSIIDDIGDRRDVLTQRLEALQSRYLRQFNALDGLLAQLQSTSNFLTQQLSQLPSGAALLNKD